MTSFARKLPSPRKISPLYGGENVSFEHTRSCNLDRFVIGGIGEAGGFADPRQLGRGLDDAQPVDEIGVLNEFAYDLSASSVRFRVMPVSP
jgi:hypothetical protein